MIDFKNQTKCRGNNLVFKMIILEHIKCQQKTLSRKILCYYGRYLGDILEAQIKKNHLPPGPGALTKTYLTLSHDQELQYDMDLHVKTGKKKDKNCLKKTFLMKVQC